MREVFCDYCGRRANSLIAKSFMEEVTEKSISASTAWPMLASTRGRISRLGRLANAELRYWKKEAHAAFDPLWKYGRFKGYRNAAYAWLAERMGLPVEKTHIGMFDVRECKKAIQICRNERSSRYGR